jgi:hypothetical protein
VANVARVCDDCRRDNWPYCGVFVVVFDGKGKVIDRHSIGLPRVDQLSNFDNDSRLIA